MAAKTVLVTGAGSGLGKALVDVLAKKGWQVISVSHADVDIADEASVKAFVQKLDGKAIDVLVNCAGVYDSTDPDDEAANVTMSNITRVFQVNTIGTRLFTDALLPNIRKGEEKLVVTISSIMGTYAMLDEGSAKHWPYSASKMAVSYAMAAFAEEHPDIHTALVHPGWMKTKMGGKDAPLDPVVSAERIVELIENHEEKLPNGKMVDYEGKPIEKLHRFA